MWKAENWVEYITRSVRQPFDVKPGGIIKVSIGGSHGQTGAISPGEYKLIANLGVQVPTYMMMSCQAVLQQPTKAENVRLFQEYLVNHVDTPLYAPASLKVIYDYITDTEGGVVDKDASELAYAFYLHYMNRAKGNKDDLVNLQANLTSKTVIDYHFGPVSSNPGELGLSIPSLLASMKEKMSLHARGIGAYFHAPPEVVTPDFGKSMAFILINPEDGSQQARRESLYTALEAAGIGSGLRMNVTASWRETPRLVALIPIDWKQLNWVFWCKGLPENVLRKLAGRPGPLPPVLTPAPIGERVS